MKTTLLALAIMTLGPVALAQPAAAPAGGAAVNSAAPWQTTTFKGVTFVEPKTKTNYADKIDFAELERKFPVNKSTLQTWTAADLSRLNQEQLDQLYARLSSGPIPDGPYRTDILSRMDGGLQGLAHQFVPIAPLVKLNAKMIESFGEYMFKGKNFSAREGTLREMLPDGPVHRAAIKAFSWGLLGTNPRFAEMTKSQVGSKKFLELFPGKVHCGQSLLDSRRESVVLDYGYGDTLPGYNSDIDFLATREGLAIREEIRMVRPGLYLGRAYMRQAFALTFSLSGNPATGEDCK